MKHSVTRAVWIRTCYQDATRKTGKGIPMSPSLPPQDASNFNMFLFGIVDKEDVEVQRCLRRPTWWRHDKRPTWRKCFWQMKPIIIQGILEKKKAAFFRCVWGFPISSCIRHCKLSWKKIPQKWRGANSLPENPTQRKVPFLKKQNDRHLQLFGFCYHPPRDVVVASRTDFFFELA